jgi:hypothetical protein
MEKKNIFKKTLNFRYFDIVRDVRQNKGSILKASVEYIKKLKSDQERRTFLEEKCRLQEYQNKKLLLKLQVRAGQDWPKLYCPPQKKRIIITLTT